MTTEDKVNWIAAYHFIEGGLLLLTAIAIVVLPTIAALTDASEFLARLPGWFLGLGLLFFGGIFALIAAVDLALGWGLWRLERWSRMASMIVAVLRIPLVPIGTVAGGAILYVLLEDETRALFDQQVTDGG